MLTVSQSSEELRCACGCSDRKESVKSKKNETWGKYLRQNWQYALSEGFTEVLRRGSWSFKYISWESLQAEWIFQLVKWFISCSEEKSFLKLISLEELLFLLPTFLQLYNSYSASEGTSFLLCLQVQSCNLVLPHARLPSLLSAVRPHSSMKLEAAEELIGTICKSDGCLGW